MAAKNDLAGRLTAVAQALDSDLLREAVNELVALTVRVAQLEGELVTARAAAISAPAVPVKPSTPVVTPVKAAKASTKGTVSAPASTPVEPPAAVTAPDPIKPSTCEVLELPEGEDYILEISETHVMNSGGTYNGETFRVSTRKLRSWLADNDFAFGYVESIVKAALRGCSWTSSSRKYSFGDCSDWYTPLEPDAAAVAADPVLRIECEVG